MASRSGPRARGSDGRDFQHREKVASHYQESVKMKVNIRKSLIPHMFLTVLALMRISSVSFFGIQYFKPPEVWELIWLLSGISAYIGFASLTKNHIGYMMTYILGNFSCGCIPLLYGLIELFKYSYSQYKRNISFDVWQDVPVKLAIIAVCLEVQVVGLLYGWKLVQIWKSGKPKHS